MINKKLNDIVNISQAISILSFLETQLEDAYERYLIDYDDLDIIQNCIFDDAIPGIEAAREHLKSTREAMIKQKDGED